MRKWLTVSVLAALAGCETAPQIEEKALVALGTEPFWSVEIAPGELTYATPEQLLGTSILAARAADAHGITWTGTLDGRALALRVEPGRCSDGMSDKVYPYTASLRLGAEVRRGCARSGPPSGH